MPKTLVVNSEEIREAIVEPVNAIVEAVKITLERTPPELSADIVDKGIVLTGSGALLRNLDILLREETGLPVVVADDPLSCVVLGSGRALDRLDIFRGITVTLSALSINSFILRCPPHKSFNVHQSTPQLLFVERLV